MTLKHWIFALMRRMHTLTTPELFSNLLPLPLLALLCCSWWGKVAVIVVVVVVIVLILPLITFRYNSPLVQKRTLNTIKHHYVLESTQITLNVRTKNHYTHLQREKVSCARSHSLITRRSFVMFGDLFAFDWFVRCFNRLRVVVTQGITINWAYNLAKYSSVGTVSNKVLSCLFLCVLCWWWFDRRWRMQCSRANI